jgi:hypothetical protein
MALADRVSMPIESADFDILVDLVTQAPTWEKDRAGGARILLQAIAEGKPDAPEQILARWTWRLARATRKLQDRRASGEYPEAKKLLGAVANSRGHRHEENVERLVQSALSSSREVGAALLASAEGYTPRAQRLLEDAKERLGTIQEIAAALAENLPAPKTQPTRTRRRRKNKKKQRGGGEQPAAGTPETQEAAAATGDAPAKPKRRRRRRKPASAGSQNGAAPADAPAPAEQPASAESDPTT